MAVSNMALNQVLPVLGTDGMCILQYPASLALRSASADPCSYLQPTHAGPRFPPTWCLKQKCKLCRGAISGWTSASYHIEGDQLLKNKTTATHRRGSSSISSSASSKSRAFFLSVIHLSSHWCRPNHSVSVSSDITSSHDAPRLGGIAGISKSNPNCFDWM